ncbi:hypothetical protein J6590_037010 [Homalodisca vitripennis]|nr:hypothetical protein J6590_037010 [Homalodisca vitripennis]
MLNVTEFQLRKLKVSVVRTKTVSLFFETAILILNISLHSPVVVSSLTTHSTTHSNSLNSRTYRETRPSRPLPALELSRVLRTAVRRERPTPPGRSLNYNNPIIFLLRCILLLPVDPFCCTRHAESSLTTAPCTRAADRPLRAALHRTYADLHNLHHAGNRELHFG